MNSFALFRYPYEQQCTLVEQTDGAPLVVPSLAALSGHEGFVVAPFEVADQQPIVLIRPDRISVLGQNELRFVAKRLPFCAKSPSVLGQNGNRFVAKRSDYAIDFANFHAQLKAGAFSKIVLARCADEDCNADITPVDMFEVACKSYPRLFIALVYTPQSGLWLTATPEVLLEGEGREWHTMALAGTMKLSEEQLAEDVPQVDWSIKNIEEQRIVATYIMETLEHFSSNINEKGPRTARAANLVHLRSDFTFTLEQNTRIGELLQALHPTPAVCGLPKRSAFEFILHNEHTPRRYYSGFLGPLFPQSGATHLYVSLRCMQIEGRHCRLYAGGGLLKGSTEEQEWQETEAKLETMRRCIAAKKM